jgi:acetone carboxylase gamma subunit
MSRSISPTLEIRNAAEGDRICCCSCGYVLALPAQPWKPSSAVSELPTDQLGGAIDSSAAETVLRLFACPGCGALLDSETALPNEPYLEDIVNP